ncbi:L-asparaginase [Streptococcus sp. HSISB1]|nr:L-asparaginase [Streptococcus sp. HSISB1]
MQADEAGHVRPENDNPMNHVGVNLDNIQVTALDFLMCLARTLPQNIC